MDHGSGQKAFQEHSQWSSRTLSTTSQKISTLGGAHTFFPAVQSMGLCPLCAVPTENPNKAEPGKPPQFGCNVWVSSAHPFSQNLRSAARGAMANETTWPLGHIHLTCRTIRSSCPDLRGKKTSAPSGRLTWIGERSWSIVPLKTGEQADKQTNELASRQTSRQTNE